MIGATASASAALVWAGGVLTVAAAIAAIAEALDRRDQRRQKRADRLERTLERYAAETRDFPFGVAGDDVADLYRAAA